MTASRHASWNEEEARALLLPLKDLPGAALPMLHAVQERFGHVPAEAVPLLADLLNLSRAEIHGVLSFYHDFRHEPPGRHVLRVCRAESCQAMDCHALIRHIEDRLGIGFGETTPDGGISLEEVFCLGHCAASPALMLDGTPHARMTPARFDALLARTVGLIREA